MRLALLLAALTALVIAAPAGAHRDGGGHHGGPGWGEGPEFDQTEADDEEHEEYGYDDFEDEADEEEAEEIPYEFSGRIRAVDVDDNTIVVRLRDRRAGVANRRPRGPRVLEFLVDEDTSIEENDADATLADLDTGAKVDITVIASEYADLDEIQETPAFIVSAYATPSFYGFAGRVVSTDDGKITVDVRKGTKAARPLLAGSADHVFTFLVDDDTRGNTSPAVGKLVGIGIGAPKDASLEQVLATPAEVVLRGGGAARLSRAAASGAKGTRR